MDKPVFRFAPSPNGYLHVGHAYSALLNLKMAREMNGKCLLRIDDIDTQRCTPELEAQMLRDLEWIGFEWDETPRRQSDHFDEYRNAVDVLDKLKLLYPSTLSRGEIKKIIKQRRDADEPCPIDPDGSPLYPGNERELNKSQHDQIIKSGTPYSLRLDMRKALEYYKTDLNWTEISSSGEALIVANPEIWGDVVLARKDFPVSYHLCCTLDDAIQGITHVVRGKDLYHATNIHVLLGKLLQFKQPLYQHHDLILDDTGEKFSKSKKHESLKDLRSSGFTKKDILSRIGLT